MGLDPAAYRARCMPEETPGVIPGVAELHETAKTKGKIARKRFTAEYLRKTGSAAMVRGDEGDTWSALGMALRYSDAVKVKKLIYLDAGQERKLKQLARKAKTSETEVIRRAIDAYGRDETAQIERDKRRVKEYVRAHPSGWADDPADFFHG